MKKKIYEIIEDSGNNFLSRLYNIFMVLFIFISIIPLMFYFDNYITVSIEMITVIVFIIDYILRWWTYNIKMNESKLKSYIKYPFSLMAIVDLLTILPVFIPINKAFKSLRVIRIIRVLRLFKILRYSKSIVLLKNVFKREKDVLLIIVVFSIIFIFMSALFIFQVEHLAQPDNFNNFFDALWWSVATLTTVGYGDLYPITDLGRIISMFISLIGIALIAVPSGIITAGFIQEIKNGNSNQSQRSIYNNCEKCDLIKDAIEKWYDVAEKSRIDESIIPIKPEHFIEFIYYTVIEDD